ncbi:LacI family DNA-binding transcriptional regulator [Maribacter polysaccharolyticus]|uniref:LacI family DNA-binding transcriptional regulator n=1 Tax=Maribacter polysaccharolyticus TaxID=3020831 RepID=UPI00237FB05D|nr:LacI family DNA-binding transcriptional regulator [Maribacter polysaccharolyticus]MDE3742934.1 LacI family DNA-binding transcriptional regulator [Maribacter polysaccharolyticus]
MKPKMTLKRIAKELGVSISTVSKALHDNKEISQENRDKIQAFAKFYNYRPNNIALSLKNKKTKTIGLIIPEIVHNFFAKVIGGIEHVAKLKGYHVIIAVTNESFDNEVINMELLVHSNIDGFIMSLSKETLLNQDKHHLQETINQGVPIVMFDRVHPDIDCDKVIVDDKEGARIATQKLIDTGCEKILLLTTEDFINIGNLRTQGYLEVLKENGVAPDPNIILKINDMGNLERKQEDLENDINKIFDKTPDIDGIFAVNEIYAITALNVARQRGLRVPEDLSVVGFSNGILSQHSWPSLTTISQHGFQMGELAATLLIDRLNNEDEDKEFETRIIKTALIDRDSTR